MDVDALRYVVTLADELHFGRAAAQHHIAAGHFGRRVQQLERELGTRLFDRTSRRVALTPSGARVVARARVVLAALAEVHGAAGPVDSADPQSVRVGVLGFGAAHRWPALRDAIVAAVPGVRLVYEELDLWDQYDAVLSGRLDVALVHHLGQLDGLTFDPVVSCPAVAVVPASSALADAAVLSVDDVADNAWVRMGSAHPRMRDWAGPAHASPRHAPLVRTPAGIPSAVATTGLLGLHGAAASEYYGRPDVRFVPFDAPPVEVALASRADDTRPLVGVLRQLATAVAALSDRS